MGNNQKVIGFDMGGTKMLASVLDGDFRLIASAKTRTPPGAGNDEIFSVILSTIREALSKADTGADEISAIGIAVPGPIDRNKGKIIALTNVGVKNFPLRDKLQKELDIPVLLENDVNAGTFGEYIAGAATGHTNVVGVFPGTGVGGGLIIGGKLYTGRRGQAGEIGHLTVMVGGPMCGCGKYGCLEAVASKTAIAKDLVHLASMGEAPTIFEKAGTDISRIKSSLIAKSIAAGENGVKKVIDRAAWFLGVGLGSCLDVFDPDVIVLGGGLVEKLGSKYLDPVEKSMRTHSMIHSSAPLVAAALGDDSVTVGAAALALQELVDG